MVQVSLYLGKALTLRKDRRCTFTPVVGHFHGLRLKISSPQKIVLYVYSASALAVIIRDRFALERACHDCDFSDILQLGQL